MGLLHEKLSYEVRACAIAVRKNFGPGHKELIYQRAFAEELNSKNISFKKEEAIEIFSPKSGKVVGSYRPDFIIEDKIVIECKSLKTVLKEMIGQLYTYLRNSEFELGFLINFGGTKLIIKRIIYSNNRKPWFMRSQRLSVPSSALIRGAAWRFGDDIDTDQIYPGKYLPLTDKQEMAKHAMEGTDRGEEFIKNVSKGDILLAGKNFGCGSSREHAPIAIRGAGIDLIIAKSFARIFHRNCVNTAMSTLELKQADKISDGDMLEVNVDTGEVKNLSKNVVYKAESISKLEREIIGAGGLLNYLKNTGRRR